MRSKPIVYVEDARLAVAKIEKFTADLKFEDFESSELIRSAVERQFQILGEALKALSYHAPELASRIPEFREVVGFRDVVVHNYRQLKSEMVWDVISGKLPDLRAALEALLSELE